MGALSEDATHTDRRTYLTGVALLLVAAALWSLNGALIKLIEADGRGPGAIAIAFYRSLFAAIFLAPFAWRGLPTLAPRVQSTLRIRLPIRAAGLWCVVFFAGMTVCFVLANTLTEAANAIILQYTSTFWVFGLSPWLLKERPRAGDLGVLGLAVVGIGIIFTGNAAAGLSGLFIALASGLFFGLLTLMLRCLRDSDSAAVTFLNNSGSAFLVLPLALMVGSMALTQRELFLLVIMGVVQFGIPYYLYTMGIARVPAYQAALITMAEPVLVPIWTYLAVGETVPRPTIIGGGVIMAALAAFIRSAHRSYPPSDAARSTA